MKGSFEFYLIFLSGLYSTAVFADPMNGYYVDLRGDTAYATFDIPMYFGRPDYYKIQTVVKCTNALGKRKKLRPGNVKMFSFNFNNDQIKMVYCHVPVRGGGIINLVYSEPEWGGDVFLRLLIDGKLKLLILYHAPPITQQWPHKERDQSQNVEYYFQKGDSKILPPSTLNFKNRMASYLSDNPSLVLKIRNGVYKYWDSKLIASEYNNSH